ncbi:hypothetical protein EJB05_07517 [Eragrostis curvula]|uniref:superoxide dismutase n=1 Tax=Eragrostis curvula TaxID=38414 RepID=A0A5J9WIL4_9POAL|nr:hypothetical protein EJB05_07517 [Eragrostis curvula]
MAAKAGGLKGVALIGGGANSTVAGALHFFQDPASGCTEVRGKVTGLAPGLHGFHIHAFGDTTNGCNSTGPHFNPHNKPHGAPFDDERHVGDLGNIRANKDAPHTYFRSGRSVHKGLTGLVVLDNANMSLIFLSATNLYLPSLKISLSGPHSILGRAVVVHADPDDLGRGKICPPLYLICSSDVNGVAMSSVNQQETQVQELDVVSLDFSPQYNKSQARSTRGKKKKEDFVVMYAKSLCGDMEMILFVLDHFKADPFSVLSFQLSVQ